MTKRKARVVRRRVISPEEHYRRYHVNGWSPVPWAHHPPDIKRAIHAARMRPKLKGCFENATRLVLFQREVELTYTEGFVTSPGVPWPFEHAWVRLRGEDVDVTIIDGSTKVLVAWEVDADTIRRVIYQRGWIGPVLAEKFVSSQRQAWERWQSAGPPAQENT